MLDSSMSYVSFRTWNWIITAIIFKIVVISTRLTGITNILKMIAMNEKYEKITEVNKVAIFCFSKGIWGISGVMESRT